MITSAYQRGFSILYITLLIASITAVFALTLAATNLASIDTTRLIEQRIQMEAVLRSCTELVLLEVQQQPSENLSGSFAPVGGTCSYTVSGAVPNKIVTIIATLNDVVKERTHTITSTSPVVVVQ